MKTIAIVSQKGGTGKTTLTTGLAVEAVASRRRAVIVDIDPQMNAANWGEPREDKDNPAVTSCQPGALPQVLKAAKEGGAQLVFIDTPGSADQPAVQAAKVADLLLMPLEPHGFSLDTVETLKTIISLGKNKPAFVVLNKAPVQGDRHEVARKAIQDDYGLKVAPVVLFNRVAHADAQNIGQTARELDPEGKAAQEMAALFRHVLSCL